MSEKLSPTVHRKNESQHF